MHKIVNKLPTKQIRNRTWKYFREQKWKEVKDLWKEVKDFLEDNWLRFLVASILLGFPLQILWTINPNTGKPTCAIVAIISLCILIFWVLIGLIALIKKTLRWLSSNWKEAKKKAEGDFK